jgi:hypothetical protein
MRYLVFATIICCLFTACRIKDKTPAVRPAFEKPLEMIAEGQALLKDGDLVLRSGQEFTSQFIRQFNRQDQSYSHSGIVWFENGYPMVFHIVPGDENPDERMRKDSLHRFANPRKNFGYAIYRYDLTANERQEFRHHVMAWYKDGVRFDSLFNLKTDDRMYCSEMIRKGLAQASNNRILLPTTRPSATEARFFAQKLHSTFEYVSSLDIVAIDNLFLNPYCRLVKRFDYFPAQ